MSNYNPVLSQISVIIPLYIPTHLIEAKLDKFLKSQVEGFRRYTVGRNFRLIYMANGCDFSIKEELFQLRNKYLAPDFKFTVIWEDLPLGYTVAANIAIKNAMKNKDDFIVFFNDDCLLLPDGENVWLDTLMGPFAVNPRAGITSVHKQYCPYAQDDFGVGYCLGVRRAMLEEIGVYDEIFSPGSCEEIDLALRAKKHGWQVVYVDEPVYSEKADTMVGKYPLYHEPESSFLHLRAVGDNGGGLCEKIFHKNRNILKSRREAGFYQKAS